MGYDGRLWFQTKIDNSQAEKDLKNLEKDIAKSEENISKMEAAKLPLQKQAAAAEKALGKAKEKLAELQKQQEKAGVSDDFNFSEKTAEYKKYLSEVEKARAAASKALAERENKESLAIEQKALLDTAQKRLSQLERQKNRFAEMQYEIQTGGAYVDPETYWAEYSAQEGIDEKIQAQRAEVDKLAKAWEKAAAQVDKYESKYQEETARADSAEKNASGLKGQIDAAEAVAAQEKEVEDLQREWKKANSKVEEYDLKIQKARTDIQRSKEKAAELRKALASPSQIKMTQALDKANQSMTRLGGRLKEIATSALIFNLISSGMSAVVKYMGAALKTNSEYTAQLAKLKGALLTAFQPIYEFILPGLITVLKILTAIAQVVADVLSFFTGKTATESAKSAKALNKETNAIEGVAEAAEEAQKSLTGFDEINQLAAPQSVGSGTESTETGAITPDFSGIEDMGEELNDILKIVGAIAAGLLTWKIARAFTNSLTLAAGLALAVAGAIMYGLNWWDAFVNGLDWEKLNGMFAGMLILVGGLALAFGTTGAAIGLLIGSVGLIIVALKEWMETGELSVEACTALVGGILGIGTALSLLTGSWIPLVIAAIVGFIVAAATNGDKLKEIFGKVIDWLKSLFLRDWTEIFGETLGGVLNDFFSQCEDYLDACQKVFEGLVDFIGGVFTGDWERAMNGLQTIVDGVVDNIKNTFAGLRDAAEGVISWVYDLLTWILDEWNSAWETISYYQSTGTIESYIESTSASAAAASTYSVPALAQGAVLPANKPFLAMVGDQKNGTNIEAPLETIKQALMEVMAQYEGTGDININFTGDLAELARILRPEIERENSRVGTSLMKGGYIL